MRENHPRQRQRAKERRKLERRKAWRQGLPTALIACEGSKTEPFYLSGLVRYLGVPPANVVIVRGASDSDAESVVRRAVQRFEESPDFDRVFAVVDGEQSNLPAARALAVKKALTRADEGVVGIELIVSRPCFEFWLLLHFDYTSKPFGACSSVVKELRAFLPDYTKADALVFDKVKAGFQRAMDNAKRLMVEHRRADGKFPGTDMPELITAIQKISQPAL